MLHPVIKQKDQLATLEVLSCQCGQVLLYIPNMNCYTYSHLAIGCIMLCLYSCRTSHFISLMWSGLQSDTEQGSGWHCLVPMDYFQKPQISHQHSAKRLVTTRLCINQVTLLSQYVWRVLITKQQPSSIINVKLYNYLLLLYRNL